MAYITMQDNRLGVADSRFEISLLELERSWEWIELDSDRAQALAVVARMEASGKPASSAICDYVVKNPNDVLGWRSSDLAELL